MERTFQQMYNFKCNVHNLWRWIKNLSSKQESHQNINITLQTLRFLQRQYIKTHPKGKRSGTFTNSKRTNLIYIWSEAQMELPLRCLDLEPTAITYITTSSSNSLTIPLPKNKGDLTNVPYHGSDWSVKSVRHRVTWQASATLTTISISSTWQKMAI